MPRKYNLMPDYPVLKESCMHFLWLKLFPDSQDPLYKRQNQLLPLADPRFPTGERLAFTMCANSPIFWGHIWVSFCLPSLYCVWNLSGLLSNFLSSNSASLVGEKLLNSFPLLLLYPFRCACKIFFKKCQAIQFCLKTDFIFWKC